MTYSQSSSSSQSTSPLTTISTTTTTTTENPTTQPITIHDEPIFSTKTPPSSLINSNVKLVEETATEILLATSPSTSPPTPIETTTKEILAAVSQPRPFGFTRGRSRATSSFLDSTTPLPSATLPSRSKVSTSSRNFARSSNTNQTRGRARSRVTTESSSRVPSGELNQRFRDDIGYQDTTPISRFRSRTRGSSRNRPISTTTDETTKSRSRDTIDDRSRSRITTSTPRNQSRRGRRPTSKSNIGRGSRNELDDSPIYRISSEAPQRDQRRSRRPGKSVDEASQITNIRIFKDLETSDRSRSRQSSRRFEDSTAQASFRDLSETTSAPRLEEETFFSPSSSYNFAKTTGTYFRSTGEKENWTGLNSIHPYYSTNLGVNTVTYPSISTEPIKNRNLRRKFTDDSSTTESTSSRRRILLLRRKTGIDTSTESENRNKRRKVIRRLRPVNDRSTIKPRDQEQFRSRYSGRFATAKNDKIQTVSTTPIPSTLESSTVPLTTNFDTTPFFDFQFDSTEGKTTLLDQTTEDPVTTDSNFKTTDFDTLPTTITPDDFTSDLKTTFKFPIFENRLSESLAIEATSPLSVTESQNSRYKYSRRPPQTYGITNARRFPTASTTNPSVSTEADPEALAKRRKNLFIRRRPSTKAQSENFEVTPKESLNTSSLAPDEFWKSFNTVKTFSGKDSTEDPTLLITQPLNLENEDKGLTPVYRRPEYRPIFRASEPPSQPDETQPGEANLRSTLSIYRKPRVRDPDDNDETPKNRFFPKRTSTTESSVTETLIPAKKFDYFADAVQRKQSQRGSSRSKNKDEDLQNFVDIYSTTPSSKPQITRLVTSVVESATTERQKILIRRKYSQLSPFIPLQTTIGYDPTSLKSKEKFKNESSTETSVEKSTLPIESAFLENGIFTTESTGESSTIEIESVFNNLISSSRDSRQ